MENINNVLPEDSPSFFQKLSKRYSKLTTILIVLLVLVILGGFSTFAGYYYFVRKPIMVLTTAYNKMFPLSSFQSEFISNQEVNRLGLKINYHQEPEKLSEIMLFFDRIDGKVEEKLSLGMRFSKDDLYLNSVYMPEYKVYEPVNQSYPELLPSQTYQLIFPIMKGTHWLHTHFSTDLPLIKKALNIPTVEKGLSSQNSDSTNQMASNLLRQAVIIRRINRRFISDDRRFYKIIVGFKKEELLNYIKSLKPIGTRVDDFLVESTIRLVESISDWNYDVAEVLIDYQDEEIYKVTLNLSAIPNEVIREILEDANKRYLYIINLSGVFSKMFAEQPSRTIQFTNFNQSPQVSLPDKEKTVELETIYRSAEREKLLPFLQYISQKVGF